MSRAEMRAAIFALIQQQIVDACLMCGNAMDKCGRLLHKNESLSHKLISICYLPEAYCFSSRVEGEDFELIANP
jgi:hypothetical protein